MGPKIQPTLRFDYQWFLCDFGWIWAGIHWRGAPWKWRAIGLAGFGAALVCAIDLGAAHVDAGVSAGGSLRERGLRSRHLRFLSYGL